MVKFIIFIFFFVVSPTVYAAEATIPIDYNRTVMGIVSSLVFTIDYGNKETALFESRTLRRADKGETYHLYSVSDDPQFNTFVSYLTNGRDDTLRFTYHGGSTVYETALESDFFNETSGYYSPDIGPRRIHDIAITIDNLDFNLSMIWIGFPLFRTRISFEATITISYNTVCIPATVDLLLSQ